MTLEKWQAVGNDYLLVERTALPRPITADFVRRLCDYHYGVGSGGLLEVVATDDATAEIVVWNPDGSTAELSGNGARIAGAWLALRSRVERVSLRVGTRRVSAVTLGGGRVALEVGAVTVGASETLALDGERIDFTPVDVGNPHAVVRHDPERSELLRLGPGIERHPRFAERTNVQLVRVDDRHTLTAAIWERGAGETLSSGTSSVAAAAAAIENGWCDSPVTVQLPGGDLLVELDRDHRARLTGPVEYICRLELARGFEP
jgi:diaminopimelate epimerase